MNHKPRAMEDSADCSERSGKGVIFALTEGESSGAKVEVGSIVGICEVIAVGEWDALTVGAGNSGAESVAVS